MRGFVAAAALATALLAGTAANAASMLFTFDAANSSIVVTDQGTCIGFGCHVTPTLTLPSGSFNINEGATQGFDFAKFQLSGIGLDVGVDLVATLAFIDPTVSPAVSAGDAFYGTFFGHLSGGNLTWQSVAPITTTGGSTFTVAFQNLTGLTTGAVNDKVFITVNDVAAAVPEPATWATMLVGLGGIGGLLRRRQRPVASLA